MEDYAKRGRGVDEAGNTDIQLVDIDNFRNITCSFCGLSE
jgi:hypothetical protein